MSTMLPKQYEWLAREKGPRTIVEGLKEYGTIEFANSRNNPKILAWAEEVGGSVDDVYKADSIPWCGLFAAVVVKRATWEPPKNPLWALSWSAFGKPQNKAGLGDVLVFTRKGGGHVAFYCGEDDTAYHCLGGNQSDKVCITRIAMSRLYAIRRPAWRSMQPTQVRPIRLSAKGALSKNEA